MSLFEKLAAGEEKADKAALPARQARKNQFWYGVPYTSEMPQASDIGSALAYGGMVDGMRAPQEAMAQYQRGLEEIARLEHTNTAIVRAQIAAKKLDYQDALKYGRDATDDAMRNLDREDERRKQSEQAQKTAGESAIAGTKAEISRVLPQAVTAPPAERWNEYLNSLKGQQEAAKQQIDDTINKGNDLIRKADAAYDKLDHAADSLTAIFAGTT
jgi:hypothetical protein